MRDGHDSVRSAAPVDRHDGGGPLPLEVRRALWDRLWLRLLAPPEIGDGPPDADRVAGGRPIGPEVPGPRRGDAAPKGPDEDGGRR
ncbi:MAG: hypothetical protein AVDCRST_MAG49-570 [uncultured Thermomicrobiales bacterium]|uniref:Uncharacterized protein n=1 Tax=uncultured Thermomicrobiales bacterium TaxID=1645740 RepID=A0A6J4U2N0_9BACT|nr:MAG: hypothetical protein AVDCRST_MAG49-570 [uncultured Thermomicrobiales bacterium]